MQRIALSLISILAVASALAETTETFAPVDPAAPLITQLPSVIVEAPEPRYVAPTLRDRIGRIWAPVLINGKGPFRLVLDTGANSSAILPSVAQSLGIPIHDANQVLLHGVTGSAVVPIINVDSLEIGDLYVDGARLPVVADVFGGAEGILGVKGLDDKRIFIDFGNDEISIARSRGEAAPLGFASMPIKLISGQLLMFEIRIGNIRTKAILDTGAQQTLGNNSLREALLRRSRDGTEASIIGVTLDVARGQSIAVPPIAFGDIEVRNMRVIFGDMFIFDQWKMTRDPAMLIGMDVIGTLDTLVIDYKTRQVHMRPRR
jgi:predicted aspartyl protease